jgi:hypothetical protein
MDITVKLVLSEEMEAKIEIKFNRKTESTVERFIYKTKRNTEKRIKMMHYRIIKTSLILILLIMIISVFTPEKQYGKIGFNLIFQDCSGKSYTVQNDSVSIYFYATIPFWTPEEDRIYLKYSNSSFSVPLSKINEVTWKTRIKLPPNKIFKYFYARGDTAIRAIRQLSYTPSITDSARYDAVLGWQDLQNPVQARDHFMGMATVIDFPAPGVIQGWWDRDRSGNYSDLEDTFRMIRNRAGLNYTGFTEGAFYSALDPLPVIVNEDQGMRDLTASEFIKIAQLAKEQDLIYYVNTGNPGIIQQIADQLGSDNPFAWIPDNISEQDSVWWDEWFKQWGDFLEPKAVTAESIGVEHFSIGGHMDYADFDLNAPRWIDLIERIRKVYSGKITYFSIGYERPNPNWSSHLDYIGVYMGRPIADNNEPSTNELVDGISAFTDNLSILVCILYR